LAARKAGPKAASQSRQPFRLLALCPLLARLFYQPREETIVQRSFRVEGASGKGAHARNVELVRAAD